MSVIPLPFAYPSYIKKEDAKEYTKNRRRLTSLAPVSALITVGILQFFLMPKIMNLYKDLNQTLPFITQTSPYINGGIIAIFVASAVYFLITPPNYKRLDEVLSKYKDGEMIKTKEVVESKHEAYILLLMGLAIAYTVISVILPIYSLTGKY